MCLYVCDTFLRTLYNDDYESKITFLNARKEFDLWYFFLISRPGYVTGICGLSLAYFVEAVRKIAYLKF